MSNTLAILHFSDARWYRFIVQLIKFSSKINGKKIQINHTALLYIDNFGNKMIAESISNEGIDINDFNKKISKYKGKVYISQLDINSDDDFENFIKKQYLNLDYSVFGALGSFEFKSCFLRPLNKLFDFLAKIFRKKNTFYCTQFVVDSLQKYAKIHNKNFVLQNYDPQETTPQDLFEFFNKKSNSILLKG